jgi:hypothetical protein
MPRNPALFAWIFALVVAPVGAAVLVGALLLFGLQPHSVFAPGHAVLAFLRGRGIHAPNAVGVLTTVGLWWVVIVAAGLAWDRRPRRKPI